MKHLQLVIGMSLALTLPVYAGQEGEKISYYQETSPQPVSASPLSENAQAPLNTNAPSDPSSLDFLANPSPMTSPSQEPLMPPENPSAENLKILVGTTCSDAYEGNHSSCMRTFSDQSVEKIETKETEQGDEIRKQVTITTLDALNRIEQLKSIYHGTQYQSEVEDAEKRKKEFEFLEFLDIHPEKSFKEILIYDYHPQSQKIQKMTWAKYSFDEDSSQSHLLAHAYLTYDAQGNPDKGLAESIESGNFMAEVLEGKMQESTHRNLLQKQWKVWENWMKSRYLSAYLS